MALAYAGGADAPLLVDEIGTLVHPVGFIRQFRSNPREHASFLFFQEETLHNGIQSGCRPCDDARTAGRSDGKQIGIAHSLPGDRAADLLPFGTAIASLVEVSTRLPVASFKELIASFLSGKVRTGEDSRPVDGLEDLVHELQVLLTLPLDAPFGQCMVITAHAQAYGTVPLVGDPGVGNRIKVEADDVVKGTDNRRYLLFHLFLVLQWQSAKRQTCQVADYELARTGLRDDNGITVFRLYLLGYCFDGSHVLGYLRAEIGAVDHSLMTIGVGSVHGIPVECERCPGLYGRAEDEANDVLDADDTARDSLVVDTVKIPAFPLLAVAVLQAIALDAHDFVRTEERPVLIQVFFGHLPEQVRIADRRENVVCLHAVVAVVGAELQELGQILVPYIQVNCHGTLSHSQLVYRYSGVVDEFHPSDDTAGYSFETTDIATRGTYLAEVHPHAAAELAHLREVVQRAVDAVQTVGDSVYEAA